MPATRKRRISKQLFDGQTAPRSVAAATYLALVSVLFPSTFSLVSSISTKDYLQAIAWLICILSIGGLAVRLLLRREPLKPVNCHYFQPFAPIESLNPWRRDEDVATTLVGLGRRQGGLAVLVGPSGSGKTVLVTRLIKESQDFKYEAVEIIREYGEFLEDIAQRTETLGRRPSIQKRLLILDQFEQYLAHLESNSVEHRTLEEAQVLREIESAHSKGIEVLIVIRHEWYYNLKFLNKMVPPLHESIHIASAPVSDHSTFASQLRGKIQAALSVDDLLATEILNEMANRGGVLPLRAQVIGAALEKENLRGTLINKEFLSAMKGSGGLIDSYFDEVLENSPNRRLSLKTLAALSASTRFRSQLPTARLLDVLYEPDDLVLECVDYLVTAGLVARRPGSQIELVHDFLAEYFHNRSGYELRPTDRDNVGFHLEAGDRSPGPVVYPRAIRNRKTGRFGWSIFWILLVLMFARLLGLGIPWTRVGSLQPIYTNSAKIFDGAYVPIFIAHGAWAIYITMFYVRVFSMLRETGWQRLMSRGVQVVMALSVVVAVFIPYAWMFSIGCGGLFLGFKLLALYANDDLGMGARTRIGEFGRTTVAALLVLTALGGGGMYLSFALESQPGFQSGWVTLSIIWGIVMTIPCLALAPYHISRPAAAELLGLMARPSREKGTV